MKRIISLVLCSLMLLSLFAACEKDEPLKTPPEVGFLVAAQFTDYRLGTVPELVPESVINEKIISPEIVTFKSYEKGLSALRDGKLHGLVLPAVYVEEALSKYDDISSLYMPFIEKEPCALTLFNYEFGIPMNAAVTFFRESGAANTLSRIHSGLSSEKYTRPEGFDTVEGRKLRVGISGEDNAPLNYKDKDGNLCGINVELAYFIAETLHAELEISEYEDNAALMKAVSSNEIDIALSDFMRTEESPISDEFGLSHPYCDMGTNILIQGDTPKSVENIQNALKQK